MGNEGTCRRALGAAAAFILAAAIGLVAGLVPGVAGIAYADGNVASVTTGGSTTNYTTLQAALDAATANSTVTLLADTSETITVSKDVGTIDFAGNTLTGNMTISYEVTVGTLANTVNGESNYQTGGMSASTYCDVQGTINSITGGHYTGTMAAFRVPGESGTTRSGQIKEISGGYFSGRFAIIWWSDKVGGTVITGGIYSSSASQYPLYNMTSSMSSPVTIKGGFFSKEQPVVSTGTPATSGAVPTSTQIATARVLGDSGMTYGGATLNAGTWYTVSDWFGIDPVAQVSSTGAYYSTLKLAIESASEGDTVTLLKDSTTDNAAGNNIDATKSMTIDGQGHTYTRDYQENVMLAVSGEGVSVTLKNITLDGGAVWTGDTDSTLGRGTTNSGMSSQRQIFSVSGGATATLESGTVLQNNYKSVTGSSTSSNWGREMGSAVLVNNGKLVMNEGSAIKDNVCTGSNGSDGAAISSINANDVITMNGGTISGNNAGRWVIRVAGTFNMNGGTIMGNTAGYTGGTQTVAGVMMTGTGKANFAGNAIIAGNYNTLDSSKSDFAQNSVVAVVKSGFSGTVGIAEVGTASGNYTNKGQTFATLESESATYTGEFINDEDESLLDVVDGTNVKWGAAVAQVTAPDGTVTKYATIAEAAAAANAAGTSADEPATLKLLDDATVNGGSTYKSPLDITGYVTIDLNGKTLTQQNSSCPVISISSGAATVTDSSEGETKGTLSGGSTTIYGAANTKLTVDADVTFTGMKYSSVHTKGEADISAGTFTYNSSNGATSSIRTDGTGASYTLTGGTYTGDPRNVSGVTIADGYTVVDNGDGTFTVTKIDDYVKLAGHSLTLDGAIGLNYYYQIDDSITVTEATASDGTTTYTLPDGYSVSFSLSGDTESTDDHNQTVFTKKGTLKDADGNDVTVYGFSVYLKSYQQANDLDSTLILSKGTTTLDTVSETDYSAFDYMNSVVDSSSTSDSLKKLMQTLANYDKCAFAQFCSGQTYAGSGDVVVDFSSEMSAVDTAVANLKQTVGEQGSFTMKHWGGSVQCQSENALAPYAKLPDGTTLDEALKGVVVLKYRKSGASEWSTASVADGGNDFVYGYTAKIPCSELDDTYELQFCSSDGTALSPVKTMSAYTWVGTVTRSSSQSDTMKDLARSLYLYGEVANTYFGTTS